MALTDLSLIKKSDDDNNPPEPVDVHCGVSTCVGLCGNVGGDVSRVFVLNGSPVATAHTLCRYATHVGSYCIADDHTLHRMEREFMSYKVDYLRVNGDLMFLWAVVSPIRTQAVEWMYELEATDQTQRSTPFGLATLMWEALKRNDVDQVRSLEKEFSRIRKNSKCPIVTSRLMSCVRTLLDGHPMVCRLTTMHFEDDADESHCC
eukprot:TRINITY_DN68267_c0_g1_i1.p1 TRINITY_DN68267_c0_g1~~TRINITY_DN68267_c0_g1_i1.p1  ORF type:complete len:223 (+),score=52.11 TRINITY_DN68267_c0_g1_i1:57-671(+)